MTTANVIALNPKIFREGHTVPAPVVINYVITKGGIGDYICSMSAILWVMRENPQVHGRLFVPEYFFDLAHNFVAREPNFKNWWLKKTKEWSDDRDAKNPTYMPVDQPITGMGMHLVDVAFIYYTTLNPPPKGYGLYPVFNSAPIITPAPILPLLGKSFAVMTPGATFENRAMLAKTFNGIKDYFISKNILPVFLGNELVGTRKVNFDEGYDYSGGLDLRGKTTLLEAAKIITKSRVVVGLDNGLLHLAATTETPIVFGYNIASPEHRKPRRLEGKIVDVFPDIKKLSCTFCQSRMRMAFKHDFRQCMYGDNKCLEEISDVGLWSEAIEECINET